VAYVLGRYGYGPGVIGRALGRERSTIIYALEMFERRIAADRILSARVERLLTAA